MLHRSFAFLHVVFVSSLCFSTAVRAADCQQNGTDDAAEIAAGEAEDCNSNGVPDECEFVTPRLGVQPGGLGLTDPPEGLVSGDLDGDGQADLVTANRDGQGPVTFSVFLREGETFAPEVRYEVSGADIGPSDAAVALADLDGDGDVDLASTAGDAIAVYANRGDGSYELLRKLAAPESLNFVTLADVSGDGVADVVSGLATGRAVFVYANRGDGSFAPPVSTALTGRPKFARAADFDADGDIDLVVGRGFLRSTLELLENQGDGSFVPARRLTSGSVTAIMARDLNGDGLVDLIATLSTAIVVWFHEMGSGLGEPVEYATSAGPMAIGDIDGDAAMDIVIGDFDGTNVTVWLNRGEGILLPSAPFSLVHEELLVLDSDGDGDLDLAVLGSSPRRVTLIVNGDTGALTLTQTRYAAAGRPHGLAAGDFTGDGLLDIVSVHCGDDNYSLFPGTGDGGLKPPRSPTVGVDGDIPACATTSADMDGDGDMDLIMRGFFMAGQGYVAVIRNDGGVLSAPTFFFSGSLSRLSVAAGDIDGDGDADVATPAPGDGAVAVHFNDGSGDLTDRQDLRVEGGPIAVTLGDLNGNGMLEVVAATGGAGVALVFQEAPATFLPSVTVPVGESTGSVAVGDFNLDGHLDVASSNQDGSVAVLMNQGAGVFGDEVRFFELPSQPNTIIAADLNSDGLPELITTNEVVATLSVLKGLGGGLFSAPETISVGTGPRLSISADVDADGDLDVIVANRAERSVSVLVNAAASVGADQDFLSTVCTVRDFESISVPSGRDGIIDRTTKFVTPSGAEPELLQTVFQNVQRFAQHQEFLREVFPERFATLDDEQYVDLALRRETRDYYAGSILRLRTDTGLVYGFDVTVDAADAAQLLAVDEVRGAYEKLRESFRLEPLGYSPQDALARESAATWDAPGFPLFLETDPEPEPVPDAVTPTPVFEVQIPAGTVVCGAFQESRSPREEYDNKSQVTLRAGTLTLPTEAATFSAHLFEEVLYGPGRSLATPLADGIFSVRSSRRAGGVTDFRFSYRQEFALEDGTQLELELASPFGFSSVGEEPIERTLVVDEDFLTRDSGLEPFVAWFDGVARARYGSCRLATLPRFEVTAELEDGTTLRLFERFDQEAVMFRTAAANLIRAEVTVPGLAPRVIDSHWDLVYAAGRHNTEIIYWVVLDPPLEIPGVGVPVHAIEFQAADEFRPEPQASYRGADFAVVSPVGVRSFARTGGLSVPFRRGDVDGGGEVNLTDVVPLLEYLFRRAAPPTCLKAADWNDSGRINLVDVVALLGFVFQDGAPAPEPFATCGGDSTMDALSCEGFPACK